MTMINDMLMKITLRHINTTQSLAGSARRAVVLLALLCYVGGSWGQTLVRKGVISSQDDVAIYNQLLTEEYPVDISSQLGALSDWTGNNIIHGERKGEHWNGTATDTYSENQNGRNDNSWSASMTKTITLPKGKYVFIGLGRCSRFVQAYYKVGNLSERVYNGGNTGLGVRTDGNPSFNSSDTYANENKGRGWHYSYIQFELLNESRVTFTIDASASKQQQFMSFTDPKLLKLSESLTTGMYMKWDGVGGNASANGNTGCALNTNTSANTFYGDVSVPATHYADLTDYSTLRLTFSDGSPRLFFNRQYDNDPNLTIAANSTETMVSIDDYGTAVDDHTWIVDLEKVANYNNLGYVHLDAIKASDWDTNVTVTSATLSGPSLRSLFHQWNGTGAGSSFTVLKPDNFVWHIGEAVAAGGVIYGENSGRVPQEQYADLTSYSKMVVTYDNTKQTPRFMFNKDGSTFVVEVNGQHSEYVSVNDNKITINLAKLSYDQGGYVHLNGIKATNDEGGSTIVSAIDLLSFNPSAQINQRVEKTFNIADGGEFLQGAREFMVKFHFVDGQPDQSTIDLYNNSNQKIASLPVDENYWFNADKFGGNVLNSSAIPHFYVRWYLKDKEGSIINIPNSLKNPIYAQTLASQGGVSWSTEMPYDNTTSLDEIMYMTVDGTPDGGKPFNLTQYDLVCAISEAGDESVLDNEVSADPRYIDIEYTFHFGGMQKISVTDKKVTHKISYLKDYADDYASLDLDKQGLSSDAQSDWWDYESRTQRVSQFEITHYLKLDDTGHYLLPTAQNTNDHTMYQRWYNYGDETDTESIMSHVTLNGQGGSVVPYYVYQNGLVTGDQVFWGENRSFLSTGQSPYAYTHFDYKNIKGKSLTVAADVSRYSDMTYQNPTSPLDGNLEEPSLTMRYIYNMKDAREMASKLTSFTKKDDSDVNDKNWMESKVFHFPSRELAYEKEKLAGYRGEFIGLRHIFSDYWIFDNSTLAGSFEPDVDPSTFDPSAHNELNTHLIPGSTYGNIVVSIYDPNSTGIRLGGYNPNPNFTMKNATAYNEEFDADYKGFYYHDKMFPWSNEGQELYGDSRFLVFRYPVGGKVTVTDSPVYLRAYFKNPNTGEMYQLAQYTLIFDKGTYGDGCATLPWTSVNGGQNVDDDNDGVYDRMDFVKDTPRDPKNLRARAGKPVAKISFDYPKDITYHFPEGYTNHGQNTHSGENYGYPVNEPYLYPDPDHPNFKGTIPDSSPIPLNFDKSNYAFDGENALFGAYGLLTNMGTRWGNEKTCLPSNDATYGYNIQPDAGYQSGFLYVDASELPGDICSTPFVGNFCSDDHLMVTGWISGANNVKNTKEQSGIRSPGGITLTLKGEHSVNGKMVTETLYRFCPNMCYELNNGSGPDGIDGSDHVVWQQFYFDFTVEEKYERYWLEVNNNCVSSQGGDFMLDNIEVYCIVPDVEPEINTPLCISLSDDGKTVSDMRLLKIRVNYNKLKSSRKLKTAADFDGNTADPRIGTAEEGFMFLDKYKFLETFKKELKDWASTLTLEQKTGYGLKYFDFDAMSVDALADSIAEGKLAGIASQIGEDHPARVAYRKAFDSAILGEKTTWHSDNPSANMKSSIMYFRWNSDYTKMPVYSFTDAVDRKSPVFFEEADGDQYVVMNGNYPELQWKTNTEYYIVNTADQYAIGTTDEHGVFHPGNPCTAFDLCSPCSKCSTFRIEPPLEVLGLDAAENMEDLVVCDGQIPTLLTNLKGYDINGNEVMMKNLNFDWWLGNKTATEPEDRLATLDNYRKQYKLIDESGEDVPANRVYLSKVLSTMRAYYPGITSLDGITKHQEETPYLTDPMIKYLREVVDKGELVLHQTAISVPAERVIDEDPYFYLVACPIHDELFDQALNPRPGNQYVAFFCDEPQGVRIKLGQKAPRLQTGFVPGEHGFTSYNYNFPANTNPVLSIRLAKAEQFETVKNTEEEGAAVSTNVNYLWLPIRNAQTEGADGVIQKSGDDNIYLASSNDLTWDKKISTEMNKNGSLPVVGRIVQLKAINTKEVVNDPVTGDLVERTKNLDKQNDENRLCVYFTNNFDVREGYNYTLSLPFEEKNGNNSCDGTILINLKIVPDYEVWTGAAGNIDWNNDENWRRADGNTTISNDVYGDELYRANGAESDVSSPLNKYTTNKDNYYSSNRKASRPSSDQILRKGFAPLYCTHVLIKNDEWGNAPELYDGLDYKADPENPGYKLGDATLWDAPFPNLRETATPILKFDMQARRWNLWEETYGGVVPDRGESSRPNDLIAEMYQINSCDEIAFQPGTELRNAHLLNYNSAWFEYQLDNKRWYLLGSPLQGTISGEWYAPTGEAKQKTTYYAPVTFGEGYDRYSPAIYQRSWDKAKTVLYEVGSTYSNTDDEEVAGQTYGDGREGEWNNTGTVDVPNWQWQLPSGGADDYLDRLGYKPMDGKKVNVAIKGVWSNTYNDAQVDYANGGFSVMVMNHLKNNDTSGGKSIIRLPKEDFLYDYYKFSEKGGDFDGGTDTYLNEVRQEKDRGLNRGRLKTDLLLPATLTTSTTIQKEEKNTSQSVRYAASYGNRIITRIPIKEDDLQSMTVGSFTETVPAGVSNLGYYLVENPFPCGLNMDEFFKANPNLETKYWLLTATGQHLVQRAADGAEWITSDGTNFGTAIEYPDPTPVVTDPSSEPEPLKFYPYAVVAPGQGFFVQAKDGFSGDFPITFTRDMQAQSRFGVKDNEKGTTYKIVVGQSQDMEPWLVDDDNDPTTPPVQQYIDVDLNGNGIYGETYTVDVEEDGNTVTKTIEEKEAVMVPKYIDDPDNPGTQIPSLTDIEEDVVIYKYVKEELIPDNVLTPDDESVIKEHPLRARQTRAEEAKDAFLPGLVITAKRGENMSSALVMQRDKASNDFLPEEDTEVFITSDLESVPTVFTLCGRLATTINSIHDFLSLPVGVESNSNAPCTLTFKGVETLGDSIAFYDAVEQKLMPLESGTKVVVSGQTQNRYYIVRSLNQKEVAEETHLQIFTEGLTAKVIASTAEPITDVRCFDTAGRLVHSANPQTAEYSFSLPAKGIYIIEAQTDNDRKTVKLMAK